MSSLQKRINNFILEIQITVNERGKIMITQREIGWGILTFPLYVFIGIFFRLLRGGEQLDLMDLAMAASLAASITISLSLITYKSKSKEKTK